MRVIGIDPGTLATGFGVVELVDGRLKFIAADSIRMSPTDSLPKRLQTIYNGLRDSIQVLKPTAVGVEKTFVSKNAQSSLKLGQAHGIALLIAEQADLPVFEFSPTEIKLAVVGYGAARKDQVTAMVTRLLGLDRFPESHHAADALAVAICYIHSEPFRRLSETAAGVGKGIPPRRNRRSKRRWTSIPKGPNKAL